MQYVRRVKQNERMKAMQGKKSKCLLFINSYKTSICALWRILIKSFSISPSLQYHRSVPPASSGSDSNKNIGFLSFVLLVSSDLFRKYRLHLIHFLHTSPIHYLKCIICPLIQGAIAIGPLRFAFLVWFHFKYICRTWNLKMYWHAFTSSHVSLTQYSQPHSAASTLAQMQM